MQKLIASQNFNRYLNPQRGCLRATCTCSRHTLNSLSYCGIRSFSPHSQKPGISLKICKTNFFLYVDKLGELL